MNTTDARELMSQLLDAVANGDETFVMGHHLPVGAQVLLRKLVDTNREIQQLEQIVERRQESEREIEQLLQAELQRLG